MTTRQSLSETVAYETVAAEFSVPLQAAGLSLGLVQICASDAGTPDALRHMLTRQLQTKLPRSEPWSVRASASPQMPAGEFATHVERVKDATLRAAHQSPVLRPVITRDRSGREITEYFGEKKSWMGQFTKEPQLMETFNGQPVRIPTVM